MMWTAAFDRFVAPARARPGIWRLMGGVALTIAIYAVTITILFGGIAAVAGPEALAALLSSIASGGSPIGVLVLLATFTGMAVGPMAAVRVLHDRPIGSLFGPGLRAGFTVGAAAGFLVLAASLLLPSGLPVARNTPTDLFLTYLPFALVGLLLQTGAEELLFRGYLQQQLAARFDHPVMWMVLPSVLFGLLHLDPASTGPNAWWIVAATGLFGLIAADLTRVTGNIGAAWGLHMVNNVFAVLIVAVEGSLSGLSLWVVPVEASELSPVVIMRDMLVTVIVWLLIRLRLAERAGGQGPTGNP
jgi:membrane protease YdiL (CAAX protease family)